MEIELMNEQEINEYLLTLRNTKKQDILNKREELFNQYKDAEYIIIHHPNENVISFGKVINIEMREDDNYCVDFEYTNHTLYYEDGDYCKQREVRETVDSGQTHLSTRYDSNKVEIITEDRFNELKELFDSIYNDSKFTELFDKLKVNK